jgi:hypothetical protein
MSYFEDYIEEGLCCESCGEFLGGDEPGFIRRCASCEAATGRKKGREPEGHSALPRFNRYNIPPRPGTIQCKHCPAWLKGEQGMHDHMHAKHIDIVKSGAKQ